MKNAVDIIITAYICRRHWQPEHNQQYRREGHALAYDHDFFARELYAQQPG
jgi:hypothetical protein